MSHLGHFRDYGPFHLYVASGTTMTLVAVCQKVDKAKTFSRKYLQGVEDPAEPAFFIYSAAGACNYSRGHFQGHHLRWRPGTCESVEKDASDLGLTVCRALFVDGLS